MKYSKQLPNNYMFTCLTAYAVRTKTKNQSLVLTSNFDTNTFCEYKEGTFSDLISRRSIPQTSNLNTNNSRIAKGGELCRVIQTV